MSFNSATSGVNSSSVGKAPAPHYGTSTFSSPTGATIATQQYNRPQGQSQQPIQQGQQAPLAKPKIVIKNPKRFLVNKNQNNQEEQDKTLSQPNQTNQQQTDAARPIDPIKEENKTEQFGQTDPKIIRELEELKKTVGRQERISALSKIIPFDLFRDKNGKFQQHLWQTEVEKMADRNLPDDVIKELYDYRRRAMQQEMAAEIQAQTPVHQKKNTGRLGASSIAIQNSSSQVNEEQDKIVKLLKLNDSGGL
jgi:hypothetical protein